MNEGVIDKEFKKTIEQEIKDTHMKAYDKCKEAKFQQEDWSNNFWEEIKNPSKYGRIKDTGVAVETVRDLGMKISKLPSDFEFHNQIKKIYDQRVKTLTSGKDIDWGTSEALAFATLISEGYHIRLSGQDVERGTFSHRHSVLHHQKKQETYQPLNRVDPSSESRYFIAANSHLAEYAVLGYEYGYAQANPNTLTIWEAQFGDFANGAQITIDTMIASGETKWNVKNGLVILLPHGFDG